MYRCEYSCGASGKRGKLTPELVSDISVSRLAAYRRVDYPAATLIQVRWTLYAWQMICRETLSEIGL